MRLKHFKNSNAKGYLVLTVEDDGADERFCISERQYADIGSPLIGDELTDEVFRSIASLDETNRAMKKALGILSFGDNSRKNLFIKLRRAGFSSKISEKVSGEMIALGYINEERQLRRIIENEVNSRLTGPRKFTKKLYEKGYSVSKIIEITNELARSGEIDLDLSRKRLIEKYSPLTEEETRALLYKQGF